MNASPHRRSVLPRKRATARTHRCVGCNERISTSVCPTCRTRKATKRGNIGKRCDALWSQIIKFPGKCFRCGTTEGLQAAHIIGRAHRSVRWNLINGLPLCHACHRGFDSYKFDREALIVKALGDEWYKRLRYLATLVWDKQYPLEALKARLAELKAQEGK